MPSASAVHRVCVVTTAVSAPLLDVLASAAVEQPPLEMPAAASASESETIAGSVTEPMPTVLSGGREVDTGPVPLSGDMPLLSIGELVAAPIHITTPRFLLCHCCLQ